MHDKNMHSLQLNATLSLYDMLLPIISPPLDILFYFQHGLPVMCEHSGVPAMLSMQTWRPTQPGIIMQSYLKKQIDII